eukprot:TRINITY_DN5642_c0_g2_i1.p1 TRINITY_DN5642_c0_g2~~TRINITY_DN5642_c0_g2_i1.p1  ORF type:complete len:173 (+),score=17.63 TRINITY_DN5642_c0_g2_i1:165-683(+)
MLEPLILSRFSFTVPHEIQRDTLYVHAQIEITLETETGRRRLLISGHRPRPAHSVANMMNHFGDQIKITTKDQPQPQPEPNNNNNNNYKPEEPQQPQQPLSPSSYTIALNSPWILAIGGILAVILSANIVFMCYMNCCKEQSLVTFGRRRHYSVVKDADSESFDDSEAQPIN